MKATTNDGAWTLEIIPKGDTFIGTVWSCTVGAYEISEQPDTGHQSWKPDPGHEWFFDSLAEAKAWALTHLHTQLKLPGDLVWE
ncbi:MAG: hypothetical protein ABIZ80_09465 [Bryobacteraceae bacterium]